MTLADTSVWIDYFHNGITADLVEDLISLNELCVNDVILAELLPSIEQRGEDELRSLLLSVPKLQLQIDWPELVFMQAENLRHGINKVGLPDLMIAQNAMQNHVRLFSCDKHFRLMAALFPIPLFDELSADEG